MIYQPSIEFLSAIRGSEQVDLHGEEPHVSVKLGGLRNSDVASMLQEVPTGNSKFIGYDVSSRGDEASLSAHFTSTDLARGFTNRAIKILDLADKGATIRAAFDRKSAEFLRAQAEGIAA